MADQSELNRIRKVYADYSAQAMVNTRWSSDNPGNKAMVAERLENLHNMLQIKGFLPFANHRILDIGCGNGDVLASFLRWGAKADNLFGIDLLPERVTAANERHPEFRIQQGNAERLEYPDEYFEVVSFFTVFSSILDVTMRQNIAREASRVLKPGGAIVWYDFRYRNLGNPNTRPMRSADIQELFPGFNWDLRTVTLLPPLARRLGRLTPYVYGKLVRVPFLRTHLIGVLSAPPASTV